MSYVVNTLANSELQESRSPWIIGNLEVILQPCGEVLHLVKGNWYLPVNKARFDKAFTRWAKESGVELSESTRVIDHAIYVQRERNGFVQVSTPNPTS